MSGLKCHVHAAIRLLSGTGPRKPPTRAVFTPDSIADLSEARLRPQLSLPLSDGLLTRLEVEPREEITHRIGSQLSCPRHKFASPYVEGSPVRLQRTGLCRPNGGSPRCIRSRCPPDRHRPRRIPRLNHRAIAQRGTRACLSRPPLCDVFESRGGNSFR